MKQNPRLPKRLVDKIKSTTKGKVDESLIRSLASGMKQEDLRDERKLRALIREVAKMVNKPITQEKEDKIVRYVKSHSLSVNDLLAIAKKLSE
ncbi:stage VI sporulation protein F [Calditerricola satsumensis]|uniref:Stage VI sporulation protein F n=1 Tax=Calditerricola satsumensis TaxID=373054 RepID=A0A8J3B503_9BACI|nr:stage VI sporulation protein F [Calditerricola satsumensis]GGJ94006.1 hypothetical protein GCM10007043_04700 [Calditerricola satsumensis]